MALINSYIDDKNRQINVYRCESISAYNDRMNTNYDFEEHEEKKWNKADLIKFVKDSIIGLIAIIALTMIVAALRFAFVAKVDAEYILAYTLEYPRLVMMWIIILWILWIIIHLLYRVLSDSLNFQPKVALNASWSGNSYVHSPLDLLFSHPNVMFFHVFNCRL